MHAIPGGREETPKRVRRAPHAGSGARATVLGALAEPNRLRIVELLRAGPRTVGEIADGLGLRQPQTSKHLKVLSDSGIAHASVDANRRIYALRHGPFEDLEAWSRSFRMVTTERLDNLDDYLRSLQPDRDPQPDHELQGDRDPQDP